MRTHTLSLVPALILLTSCATGKTVTIAADGGTLSVLAPDVRLVVNSERRALLKQHSQCLADASVPEKFRAPEGLQGTYSFEYDHTDPQATAKTLKVRLEGDGAAYSDEFEACGRKLFSAMGSVQDEESLPPKAKATLEKAKFNLVFPFKVEQSLTPEGLIELHIRPLT